MKSLQFLASPSILPSIMENKDFRSFLGVSIVLVLWVELVKYISHQGWMNAWTRRKIMHCLTGPIFLLFWPAFSTTQGSLYAAAVPLFMTLKFLLIGLGILKDEDAVKSMCRQGDRIELLRGPLLYGIVFVLATACFWKQTRAVICFFSLCFGDGFAEIFGRRFGNSNKLFWSKEKSWAGMFGFVLAATTTTIIFLSLYPQVVNDLPKGSILGRVLLVNLVASLVESLPVVEIDNITVFFAAFGADMYITDSKLF